MPVNKTLLSRAQSAVISRDFELAVRLYKEMLQESPDDIELLRQMGNLYVKSGKDGSAEEKLENFKDLFSPSYGISTARKSDAWKDEYFSVFTDFMRRENTEKITYEEILRTFQKKDELKKKMRIFICKQNAPHTKSRKADS